MFRKLILLIILCTLSISNVQAQAPSDAEQKLMLTVMETVIGSPLTQKDIDVFVKTVNSSKEMKKSNLAEWERIDKLALIEKREAINKSAGLATGEDYFVSSMRVQLTRQLKSDPTKEQVKAQQAQAKQQAAAMEAQLKSMPAEQQSALRAQLDLSLKMIDYLVAYPDASVELYKTNETKIEHMHDY